LRLNDLEEQWEAYSDEADSWGNYYLGVAEETTGNHYMVHAGEVWQSWRCPTRQFITASRGCYIVEADYSQIELRVMAGESREPSLLEAYMTGDDVHTKTAAVLFGVDFDKVTKVQRSIGKTINFGLLYGAGPQRISQELGITLQEAKEIVDRYFENLPMIKSWINRMKADARMDGYAETAFKRRRYFPEIKTGDHGTRAREEREAVNHHIQGAAADVMKIALTRLHTRLREYFGDKVRVMCTVHDSVILEVDDSIAKEDLAWVMKDAMEFNPFVGKWPDLEIDLGYGRSWAETEKLELPEGHPAPSKIDVAALPRLRNRLVGREYEGDMSGSVEFSPVDFPAEPEDETKIELTAEEVVTIVDTDTGEVTETSEHEDIDVHWKLDVANFPLNKQQGSALRDFLAGKTTEDARGTLTMAYKEPSGAEKAITYKSKYDLSFDDELHLKLILGPCKLRQDSSHFDVGAVISRLGT
jgi:hypothetical protein